MIDIKQRQRQAWGAGDYRTVAARLQIVGGLLCEAVDPRDPVMKAREAPDDEVASA